MIEMLINKILDLIMLITHNKNKIYYIKIKIKK